MRVIVFWICSLMLFAPAFSYKSYAGYQVLRTAPLDESSLLKLAPLLDRPEFDFWSTPRVGQTADIMAAPEHVSLLRDLLALQGLEPTVLVPDVGVTIEKEREEIEIQRSNEKLHGRAPSFDRYMNFDEIQAYLNEVVATYPSIASIQTIGTSYEGRALRVLKLSNGPNKTGIWFESVIHAREWLGPPTVMYAINQLTEHLATNQAMLNRNDFYFLPVANPDGYTYTWTNDRMWRKTRRPNSGSSCVGTDPNRNFDYSWAGGGVGAPCSETHAGTGPNSEPEVKAMNDFLTANTKITFYTAVHSYGNYLLYPYGDKTSPPTHRPELETVGHAAANAIAAVAGTRYTVGSTANVLYTAYGVSVDWAYEKARCMLSYTIELPGGGSTGFNPPAGSILPVVRETWEGYKVFAAHIPASRLS